MNSSMFNYTQIYLHRFKYIDTFRLDYDVLQYGKQLSGLMEDKRWQALSRRGKMRLYNSYLKRLKQQKGPTFRIFNKDGSPNFGD